MLHDFAAMFRLWQVLIRGISLRRNRRRRWFLRPARGRRGRRFLHSTRRRRRSVAERIVACGPAQTPVASGGAFAAFIFRTPAARCRIVILTVRIGIQALVGLDPTDGAQFAAKAANVGRRSVGLADGYLRDGRLRRFPVCGDGGGALYARTDDFRGYGAPRRGAVGSNGHSDRLRSGFAVEDIVTPRPSFGALVLGVGSVCRTPDATKIRSS